MTDLDARYGRRPPMSARRRWLLGTLGVLVLIAVSLAVTASYLAGRPKASAEVASSRTVSDQSVQAQVVVTKPKGRAAACEVRALDSSFSVVGVTRVTAPAGSARVRIDVTIPTTGRAAGVRPAACVLE